MKVRDHDPIVIDEFHGMWKRDKKNISCPINHFQDCNNIQFEDNTVRTRDGIDTIAGPGEVVRMYRYKTGGVGEGLLALDVNGKIWHQTYNPDTTYGPILNIPGITDFAFVEINGRAYISPITGIHGTASEFLYVYQGDGAVARKAAGNPPTNTSAKPFIAFNSLNDGLVDKGVHILYVIYNDASGLSSALGPSSTVVAPGLKEIQVTNIPIGAAGTTERRIYMTRAIDPKDYNPSSPPTAYLALTISDNTTISALVSISDANLTTAFAAGGGAIPSTLGMRVVNSTTNGNMDQGFHLFGVVYETDTGYLTAPGPEFFAANSAVNVKKAIDFSNIPVSPDSFVTKRHLVATKVINDYNGDQAGYQFFFIPDGTIEDNVTTTKTLSFYDADLLEDASYLIDNFAEIPAGAVLDTYNSRMILANTEEDENIVYLSAPGEPEAIDQVDGFLLPPYRTEHITHTKEFRDVLYVLKSSRIFSYVDNGDVPSLWAEPTIIDNGIGCGLHGIALVLDSGGVNVEFLLVSHASGIYLFTGSYIKPELSYKIAYHWLNNCNGSSDKLQLFVDSTNMKIYISLENGTMIMGDFKEGLNPKDIKWTPWSFDIFISTIALFNGPRLILGSSGDL